MLPHWSFPKIPFPMRTYLLEKSLTLYILGILSICLTSCNAQDPNDVNLPENQQAFNDYWFNGQAEISKYNLEESRYGQVRKGYCVLIYVSENFLPTEQVKHEEDDGKKDVTILKMNGIRRFVTGIYDYSLMRSVFTPVETHRYPYTLKTTFSRQDWCGQEFSQLNHNGDGLQIHTYSYLQKEGDVYHTVKSTYIEDDIWTRLRINPQTVPLGKIKMLPSLEYLRMHGKEIKPYKAETQLNLLVEDNKSGKEYYIYTIKYPELNRVVQWKCSSSVPFQIVTFTENLSSSKPDQNLVTTMQLDTTLRSAYWDHKALQDSTLRKALKLNVTY